MSKIQRITKLGQSLANANDMDALQLHQPLSRDRHQERQRI